VRVPYGWLRDWLADPPPPEEAARLLTGAGLETTVETHLGQGVQGVVVATARQVAPLAGADHLYRVELAAGSRQAVVLTGAGNVRAGDRVPWIAPGGILPGGAVIESRVLRGQRSEGMLGSAAELGLGDDPHGILILDPTLPEGADLNAALALPEAVLNVDLTPNLGHCLSVRGVARELAALTGRTLAPLPAPPPLDAGHAEGRTGVADLDPAGVAQYLLLDAWGDPGSRTPPRVVRRLLGAGYRLHGLVVDVTNYVMHDLGQPLHGFDAARIAGGALGVRRARRQERLRTLDGEVRTLEPQVWVIADAAGAVGLAGVMGGQESEISAASDRAVLESATFLPEAIRASCRALRLRSEASQRFTRGVDPALAGPALAEAQALLSEAGWQTANSACGTAAKTARREMTVRPGRLSGLLGGPFAEDEMRDALRRLGFGVAEAAPGVWRVSVPSHRYDVAGEADLAEEVGRLLGLDRVPERLPAGGVTLGAWPEPLRREEAIVDRCLALGLTEVVTSSLVSSAQIRAAREDGGPIAPLLLANPLSPEEDAMRPSFLVPLARAARTNLARGAPGVWLVDRGAVYGRQGAEPIEERALGILMVGAPVAPDWHGTTPAADIFVLRGIVERLLDGVYAGRWRAAACDDARLHPGRRLAYAVDGVPVAVLGEVHPTVAEGLRLPERVLYSGWRLDRVSPRPAARPEREPARFPYAARDIAVVVPEALPAGEVLEGVRRAAAPLAEEVRLFDVYRGDPVPEGHRSLAIAIRYRAADHTLGEEEVHRVHERVREALRALGGDLRS
jgi:phenylalanyl-tRNA synthetase beta chain